MSGEERRGKIIQALKNSDKAVSATTLAKEFDVSRQVIVQDVALLRANGKNIFLYHSYIAVGGTLNQEQFEAA